MDTGEAGGDVRVPDKATWKKYLRSKAWRDRRMEAIEKAGFRCHACGRREWDTSKLQVHHLSYDRLGREEDEDLEVWCERCHRRAST